LVTVIKIFFVFYYILQLTKSNIQMMHETSFCNLKLYFGWNKNEKQITTHSINKQWESWSVWLVWM